MYRIFCSSKDIDKDRVKISDKQEIHHIKDVLWLKINDEIKVLDENGKEYNTVIEKISSKDMVLKITEAVFSKEDCRGGLNLPYSNRLNITLGCAIPKNAKFDDIVDKLTQLGVDRIIPLETERVIVKLDKHKGLSRIERWRKIAKNASNQSQRNTIPVIDPIKKINDLFSESDKYDLKLIPTLEGRRKTLKEIFTLCPSPLSSPLKGRGKPRHSGRDRGEGILILIGPEGDFSPSEVDNAINSGFIPITLGDTVLRVDTAAIAVVSFIKLSQILY